MEQTGSALVWKDILAITHMISSEVSLTTILLFGLTGTGYFDMYAYENFHNGTMSDYIPTDEDLKPGFDSLPKMD